jgi:ribonuclease-3
VEVQQRLGYEFEDGRLLELALSHRSWCAEMQGVESNERLEFLGDSVLGLVVTERIYELWPGAAEGLLARVRSGLVNAATLAEAAREIRVGEALRLGKGEAGTGGRDKTSILADAMEAIIGAIYLDAGMDSAREVLVRLLRPHVPEAVAGAQGDPKSRLQEMAVQRDGDEPRYEVEEDGPAHERAYLAYVTVGEARFGPGAGRSKKEAERAAASAALAEFDHDDYERGELNGGMRW